MVQKILSHMKDQIRSGCSPHNRRLSVSDVFTHGRNTLYVLDVFALISLLHERLKQLLSVHDDPAVDRKLQRVGSFSSCSSVNELLQAVLLSRTRKTFLLDPAYVVLQLIKPSLTRTTAGHQHVQSFSVNSLQTRCLLSSLTWT